MREPVQGIIKKYKKYYKIQKGDEIHTRRQSSYFNIRNSVESRLILQKLLSLLYTEFRNGIQTEGATVSTVPGILIRV
jgi:hypothetical protein